LNQYKLIFLLSIVLCSECFSKTTNTKLNKNKIKETKEIISALLPLQKSNAKNELKFKVDKCQIDKSKWIMLLVAKTPFTESLKFIKKCDVQGTYTAKREIPFPVNLNLKNLKNFKQVRFNFLINVIYDPTPMIKIQMQNGILNGTGNKVTFDVKYSAEIDPFSKEIIKKDNGGTLRIKTIDGVKINQEYPLKIK
jgi:hypothetical protein